MNLFDDYRCLAPYKLVRYMPKMMGCCNKKERGKEFKIVIF